ncbi:2-succinyl-6-hydroxy-2,4-cyclohexadiene-1-carboxylate synthase [Nostoc sp. FACHB-152]|uniref:2-succinyl-6-hydroxy-2, 4-cyclohexadiene-1-carboxylate synthase n=1 Tax=unclassified Nostoc TaxID=2593658 RepID=UPI001685F5F5|nr:MULTISPECIES: 2-succinyl-6-hydroxy-2,4-cyclohexadiene-1-carboxylate synthase [unclassified Nostoc]MBD2450600.1 2-succinyl-6-hydroxy-2,4-cyclohexadiene-1-carboxylate synthase [Nostoc sp. FACHB-152]MBD2471235.1 2-succinyl-6-hydroxy-2,4-cyclohexadiene-1-carboxylate synthase [Nostoc sp. FACHB-145]
MLKNYQLNYNFIKNNEQPVMLFLHGFIGKLDEFDEVIKFLGIEFSYLTVDLPGHGKTKILTTEEYYKIEQTAQGLINLLDYLNIPKCFLVGYSMGGRLGLYLTVNFPERFKKVVLESASPGLCTEKQRLERILKDEQIARKLTRTTSQEDFRAFLLNWYNQPIFGSIKKRPEFARMLESRLENNPLELAKSLRFMGTGSQPSLWENLKDIKVPLLLLVGEEDEKFLDINTNMSQICKSAYLKVINNAAHNVHLENTGDFVQSIQEFLS